MKFTAKTKTFLLKKLNTHVKEALQSHYKCYMHGKEPSICRKQVSMDI